MTSRRIFFISDTHFFHDNILKFKDKDGDRIRGFECIEDMHETIVNNWNACVRPQDKIYHLGDVTFKYNQDFEKLMKRLNGHKRLILGNHDKIKGTCLMRYFEKVEVWRMFPEHDFVATHVPIHLGPLEDGKQEIRKYNFNVHGHTHQNHLHDGRYINICVENTAYCPVHIDEIKFMIDLTKIDL